MSFTDQKPRIATAEACKQTWGGGKDGKYFRCYLCGHKFEVGDQYRWVYTNNVKGAGGNPMVCKACDGTNEEVISKWKTMCEEAITKYWSFTRHD